jgi:integrase
LLLGPHRRQKTVSFAQVGQIYFGGVGQFCIGADTWAKHRRFTEAKSAKTVNEQRRKLRLVYRAATSEKLVETNPVTDIETFKASKRSKAVHRRLPFSNADLAKWFSHPIFTEHVRSNGQGGEATYWVPLLMFYTGARPEELAGLDVSDVRKSSSHGHFLRITDLPSAEDAALFWNHDDETVDRRELIANAPVVDEEKRGIKNAPSRRSIPLAAELVELGFLDYVETVRAAGHKRLFSTLKPSCKGKVSDALLKALGRCLRDVGITDKRKTMYSFRHTMKMLLEEAKVESKLLKRILGHATGDGAITDGYGVDVPLGAVADAFAMVKFPAIPVQPWRPGAGSLRGSAKPSTPRSGAAELSPVGAVAAAQAAAEARDRNDAKA